jgi:glycosyltransferase involved in cell wall biosynthesis
MPKPRVAFLLQMFGIGGMPKWLYRLASQLRDEFDFIFIATHSSHVIKEYRQVAKVVVLPLNKWVLAAYLFLNRVDIVQTANLRVYIDAARIARVPVVIERVDGVRGGAALGDKTGLDAVIASTKGITTRLKTMIDEKKIHVIYNGVPSPDPGQQAERYGFAEGDLIIGRTSRLAGGKNISILIKAVIELRKDLGYRHVRLVICGGDTTQPGSQPMLAQLKEEARPLGDSVVFTGEVFDPTRITLGFDIATCTSLPDNEGIPNTLIEAMALGKPVVASRVGDIPELVEDGERGFLFESNDLNGLVAQLKRLLDNKNLRNRLGKNAAAYVKENFDLATQCQKYASLYLQLLMEKGAA